MKFNNDIREELNKYDLTYADILKYIPNFSHTTRISEELALPLKEDRKKAYLLAIRKAKEEKRNIYND